jgi:5-methylcytosine-specific restriction endonuclease McrA
MEQFTRKCEWCSAEYETEFETKAYCSRSHKEQARQHRKRLRDGKVRPTYTKTCIGCSYEFSTTESQRLYCSDECKAWQKSQSRRSFEKAKSKSFRANLYFQANGQCGICNEPIDTTIKYPDQMSLSIDHIIPRSKGGSDNITNLRVAHWICNIKRSNNY